MGANCIISEFDLPFIFVYLYHCNKGLPVGSFSNWLMRLDVRCDLRLWSLNPALCHVEWNVETRCNCTSYQPECKLKYWLWLQNFNEKLKSLWIHCITTRTNLQSHTIYLFTKLCCRIGKYWNNIFNWMIKAKVDHVENSISPNSCR